ncbi:glycosyltransferase family 39 protein [Vibrio sinensis]|uniref:Glycosyltransferase family 39 protein n=1 Tax=Vibrio sinensis TaxID=2302434 RepID=A0A3A6QSH9_9VIBR|nr:glycosyltransferase family 39 protein [Vibrio sinensis]RJX73606.1 glycosyltransferase family 39 protein [Vibrio sinensis]
MNGHRMYLWAILGAALLIRLLSLSAYPLMDTTEARYGEMARLMVETSNWLTPQFDYGIPFWGKPPLFTWMSALGIESFGINEFAVRVPHWLAGVIVIGLMSYFSRKLAMNALITALVLATCGIFSISSGAVMTDMALTLGMTLAIIGFYFCWQGSRIWGYVGFIGLAVGLLAKGPLIIVLVGLVVMPWLIIQHGFITSFKVLWSRFPLISGSALMLMIAAPWYIMAEHATPGFLDYFLVGEHINRFLVSGWEGDLYGSAHNEPRGTIWLFWLYSALPWSVVLPVLLWKKRHDIRKGSLIQKSTLDRETNGSQNEAPKGVLSLLFLWMLSPLVLFTLSGNILPAYVLPGIPALGGLISLLMPGSSQNQKWFKVASSVVPVLLIGAVIYLQFGTADRKSDRVIFSHANQNLPTYYVGHRPFSGQFYSYGKATPLVDQQVLSQFEQFQLVGVRQEVNSLVEQNKLSCVIEYTAQSQRSLYRCHHSL